MAGVSSGVAAVIAAGVISGAALLFATFLFAASIYRFRKSLHALNQSLGGDAHTKKQQEKEKEKKAASPPRNGSAGKQKTKASKKAAKNKAVSARDSGNNKRSTASLESFIFQGDHDENTKDTEAGDDEFVVQMNAVAHSHGPRKSSNSKPKATAVPEPVFASTHTPNASFRGHEEDDAPWGFSEDVDFEEQELLATTGIQVRLLPDQERETFTNPLFGLDDDGNNAHGDDGGPPSRQNSSHGNSFRGAHGHDLGIGAPSSDTLARARATKHSPSSHRQSSDSVGSVTNMISSMIENPTAFNLGGDNVTYGDMYPTSNIRRIVSCARDWAVADPAYHPVEYTHNKLKQSSTTGADDVDPLYASGIAFNTVSEDNIDRTSYEGVYAINSSDNTPQNIGGRTGIRGRGLLRRWGPNHTVTNIATRWAFYPTGEVLFKGGRKVLEVAVIDDADGRLSLPRGFIQPSGDEVTKELNYAFSDDILKSMDVPADERKEIADEMELVYAGATEIYKGYVDDDRNTDNAWIETTVLHFHDDDGLAFGNFPLNVTLPVTLNDDVSTNEYDPHAHYGGVVKWVMVQSDVPLPLLQKEWLLKVAEESQSFWESPEAADITASHGDDDIFGSLLPTPTSPTAHLSLGVGMDTPTTASGKEEKLKSHEAKKPKIVPSFNPPPVASPTRANSGRDGIPTTPPPTTMSNHAVSSTIQAAGPLDSTPLATPHSHSDNAKKHVDGDADGDGDDVVARGVVRGREGSGKSRANSLFNEPPPGEPHPVLSRSDSLSNLSTRTDISVGFVPGLASQEPFVAGPVDIAESKSAHPSAVNDHAVREMAQDRVPSPPPTTTTTTTTTKVNDIDSKEETGENSAQDSEEDKKQQSGNLSQEQEEEEDNDPDDDDDEKGEQEDRGEASSALVHPVDDRNNSTKEEAPASRQHYNMDEWVAENRQSLLDVRDTFLENPDTIGSFTAEYLGFATSESARGDGVIAAAYQHVMADASRAKGVVEVDISPHEITITAMAKTDKKGRKKSTRDAGAAKGKDRSEPDKPVVLKTVLIQAISYAGVDPKNRKIFAFVASVPGTTKHLCHVFKSKKTAMVMADAVGEAFQQAKIRRGDPFALKRETIATPDIVAGFFEELQFDRSWLKAKSVIGHGQYGKVYLSAFQPPGKEKKSVAVKLMKPHVSAEDSVDFLREACMMTNFREKSETPRHSGESVAGKDALLQIIGACVEKSPWLIVVEFMQYKDLGIVLKQCKKSRLYLRGHEQTVFLTQVASGLTYLAERRFLHRDVAARNVLLDHNNKVKIGDFGLMRRLDDGKDFWKLDKSGKLPVRYMAPESLTKKHFSLATDVWAFGVYMWEVMTYGETPWSFQGVKAAQVKKAVCSGDRLVPPEAIHPDSFEDEDDILHVEQFYLAVYDLCMMCWTHEPSARPRMAKLHGALADLLEKEKAFHKHEMRDVGRACFQALEKMKMKGIKRGERGGSIIKALK